MHKQHQGNVFQTGTRELPLKKIESNCVLRPCTYSVRYPSECATGSLVAALVKTVYSTQCQGCEEKELMIVKPVCYVVGTQSHFQRRPCLIAKGSSLMPLTAPWQSRYLRKNWQRQPHSKLLSFDLLADAVESLNMPRQRDIVACPCDKFQLCIWASCPVGCLQCFEVLSLLTMSLPKADRIP